MAYGSDHCAMDRKCPIFLKAQELIAIRMTQKVDHKTARSIYFTRHNPIQETSYSQTLKNPSPTENPTRAIETQIHNKNEIHKKPTALDDFLKEVDKKYAEISKIVRTATAYDIFDEEMRLLTNDDFQEPSTSTNDRALRSQTKEKSIQSNHLKTSKKKNKDQDFRYKTNTKVSIKYVLKNITMEYKGIFEPLQPTTNTHQDIISTNYLTPRNTHTIFSLPTDTDKLYTNKHWI